MPDSIESVSSTSHPSMVPTPLRPSGVSGKALLAIAAPFGDKSVAKLPPGVLASFASAIGYGVAYEYGTRKMLDDLAAKIVSSEAAQKVVETLYRHVF